ncbi:hypothetical protein JYU34_004943 [Plutella xylostella]|uniref:Odorant receptor n=1 Tax=Plutella xylostella TaxID=51655 RepID=A0ABQ7QVI7_PLUXY|nr:hypothetical protein JYU34_004943 [Plutella xylostella]
MTFFGVWLPPKRHIILHNIYMLLVMVSQYSFLLFEFIYLFDVLDDLEAASEASYLLFTQASLCYKTTVFLVNKRHLIELLELMRCEMFAPETEVHEKFLSVLAVRIRRLCLFFMTSALTTCTLWAMIPLFDNLGRRSFPFRICLRFLSLLAVRIRRLCLFFMTSALTTCTLWAMIPLFDNQGRRSFPFRICLRFLSLLAVRIRRLCLFFMTSALTTCTLWAMIPLFDNQGRRSFPFRIWMPVTPERSPQYQLGYLYQVAAIYISAFLFIAVDSVAVCMIMFGCAELDIIMDKVTKVSPDSVQFFSMCNYMVTMLSQLFLYCWCGHELTIRSEKLREVVYQCPWYQQGAKFNRLLWIAMERMKKPIIFKAGHYIPLSRQTFIAFIIKIQLIPAWGVRV